MGGAGSGPQFLRAPKKTVENCASISTKELLQHNVFTSGEKTQWKQQSSGSLRLQVIAQAQGDTVTIVSACLDRDKDPQAVTVTVTISWSDCHFGGRRPWFICPAWNDVPCEKRVTTLYLSEHGFFRCRHCAALGYKSDHAEPRERVLHQAQKIQRRLGGSGSIVDPFPSRPKGMHYDIWHSSAWKVNNLIDKYARLTMLDGGVLAGLSDVADISEEDSST